MIPSITSTGPGSIFPAAPSPANSASLDFASALFALIGAAAAPAVPVTTSGTATAVPTGKKAITPDIRRDARDSAEEQKRIVNQETASVAAIVPLPLPIPQPLPEDGGAPFAEAKAVFSPKIVPIAAVVAGPASVSRPAHVDSPATVQPIQPEAQPSSGSQTARAQTSPSPTLGARLQSNTADLLHADAERRVSAQNPASRTAPDKIPGPLKTQVVRSNASASRSHPADEGEAETQQLVGTEPQTTNAQTPASTTVLDPTPRSVENEVMRSTASEPVSIPAAPGGAATQPQLTNAQTPASRTAPDRTFGSVQTEPVRSTFLSRPVPVDPGAATCQAGVTAPQTPASRTAPDKTPESLETERRPSAPLPVPAAADDVVTQPQPQHADTQTSGFRDTRTLASGAALHKTVESQKNEVVRVTASDLTSSESHPEVRPAIPGTQEGSRQGAVPSFVLQSHSEAPQITDASAPPFAPPVAPKTELDRTLESVTSVVTPFSDSAVNSLTQTNPAARGESSVVSLDSRQTDVSIASRPSPAQVQSQRPSGPAPASINPVMVNPFAQAVIEQAAGAKSTHDPQIGKLQSPAASTTSADHRGSKERVSRASGPGQTTQDVPTNDAVRANDLAGAAGPPSPKVQPAQTGSEALQPSALRADVVARLAASNPSPKPDAPSQPPGQPATVTNPPLPSDTPSQPIFHSAQLLDKVSQAELRLGMRTNEFGNVEIRTSFDHQQVKAEISSERGELGRALSTELPGFEQRMREQDVPLSTVVVHDGNGTLGGGLERDPRRQPPLAAPADTTRALAPAKLALAAQPEAWEPEGILDVRI